MAKKVTAMKPRTAMIAISTVVLPEGEVVEEEVELAEEEVELAGEKVELTGEEVELEGDVATGAVGLEELPAAPTRDVVLVGIV